MEVGEQNTLQINLVILKQNTTIFLYKNSFSQIFFINTVMRVKSFLARN